MPIASIGDMAQHFLQLRNSTTTKMNLNRLSQELSTGHHADISRHLRGDTLRLSGIDHSLALLESYDSAANEALQKLDEIQSTLSALDSTRNRYAQQFLSISRNSPSDQVAQALENGASVFSDMVAQLNTRTADRSLFSGGMTDGPSLESAETMIANIVATIGGATDRASILSAVDNWFDAPGGGFETLGYLGTVEPSQAVRVAENKKAQIENRADDPAFRTLLKGAAVASVTAELAGSLTSVVKGDLLQESGIRLLASSSSVAGLQSRFGFLEEAVAEAQTINQAQRTGFSFARNELTVADPFEVATQLQAVQVQLETHYKVTARLSGLTLANYI